MIWSGTPVWSDVNYHEDQPKPLTDLSPLSQRLRVERGILQTAII